MNREDIFEIFMQADLNKISFLADKLKSKYDFEILKKPEQGLIMYQMEESVEKINFNVGEILVTQVEVRYNKSIGYAVVFGINNEKALNNAIVMCVYEEDLPEKKDIINLAEQLKLEDIEKMKDEREIINSTRVKFEVMGGQDQSVAHNKEQ